MPIFFADALQFRDWLAQNSGRCRELLVGFHKMATGRPSLTWPQAVDEALCVGWIDGVRQRIDAGSYSIRFTPRRRHSRWSAVNIGRVAALRRAGRMTAAGLAAYARRTEARSRTASYEQAAMPVLDQAAASAFRRNRRAWVFFQAQAPSYRKKALWIVVSAQREATRHRRLEALIAASAKGRRL